MDPIPQGRDRPDYVEFVLKPLKKPEGVTFWQHEARNLVSDIMDKSGVSYDPLLFTRDAAGRNLDLRLFDKTGKPIGSLIGPTPVVISGSDQIIRITATGQAGIAAVTEAMPHILMGLNLRLGPCDMRRTSGVCGIGSGTRKAYHVGKLVVAQNYNKINGLRHGEADWSLDGIREHIMEHIFSYIEGQAHFLQMDGRDAGVATSVFTDLQDRLPARAALASDTILVQSPQRPRISMIHGVGFLTIKHLTVVLPIELTGPWAIGHIRAHGYGRLNSKF